MINTKTLAESLINAPIGISEHSVILAREVLRLRTTLTSIATSQLGETPDITLGIIQSYARTSLRTGEHIETSFESPTS